MKLLYSAASPFVRVVMVAAHECGVADQLDLITTASGPVKPDTQVLAQNPVGKVPCLMLDDGRRLFDSRVISQYLAHLAPQVGLYPVNGSRFDVLTLEALGIAMLDAALLCRYERVLRVPEIQWEDWYDGQIAKLDRALDDLEATWTGLLDSGFHAGSIAVATALAYLDFRFADKDWRGGHPQLAAWFAGVSDRPSMRLTQPPV